MTVLDRRLNAFRPDLADSRLTGRGAARRFEDGRAARVVLPVADMRPAPRGDAGIDTQLVFGDEVRVFDEHGGWSWVQSVRDGYVGYVPDATIALGTVQPTYLVAVPRSFVYSRDDMKSPRIEADFVYPEELRHSKRVAVFRDFLVGQLAAPARLAAQ